MEKWTDMDYPDLFDKLPKDRQNKLLDWIDQKLQSRESFNPRYTSYGLKQSVKFEDNSDYFSNGEFKGAMLKSGYKVKDKKALNWIFNISDRSPLFKHPK